MKRFLINLLCVVFLICTLCAQEHQSTITDVKITISVPKYDENGNLIYDTFEKSVPSTIEEAKRDIGTILSVYNTTSNSYVKHVENLEKTIEELNEELEGIKELYRKAIETKDSSIAINEESKKTNSETLSLLPHFGISGYYGTTFKDSYHLGIITGDLYFRNLKFSLGPFLNILEQEKDDKTDLKTNLGFIIGFGYKF